MDTKPSYLLQGAVYALEQCGVLLRDANLLFAKGSYATALGVAAFAREELGRFKILLDFRAKALNGEPVSIQDVRKPCGDHEVKQESGQFSVVMPASDDSVLGRHLRAYADGPQGGEKFVVAQQQIVEATNTKKGAPQRNGIFNVCRRFM